MSVGDGNSVDRSGSTYPTTGDLQGSDPALAAEFQASLQLARQNMTAGQRYALNGLSWPPNQTATDASPPFNFQQPSPQTKKVPLPTNTPDPGRPTVSPFGWLFGPLLAQIGLVGAAFQQLRHMQHMIENKPASTIDGKRFDPDALQKETMKDSGVTNRQELNELIRNASDAGRQQPAGIDPTEKPDPKPQSQPTPGFSIETRTQEEHDLVANMQALGHSNEEIQNALAALRAGHQALFESINTRQRQLGKAELSREEYNTLVSKWNKGTFENSVESLRYHIDRHANGDPANFLRSAAEMERNRKGSRSVPDGDATKYIKSDRFIVIDNLGRIRSYGRTTD
jgi:hypothetical protein